MSNKILVAAITAISLTACTVHAPLQPLPKIESTALSFEKSVQGRSEGAWPERQWWDALGDPQLSTLIAEALAGSPDMDIALARLYAAEARAKATGAPLTPSIDANGVVQRSLLSANGIFPPPIGGSTLWQNKASLDFRWELDLWGRQRSALKGALRDAQAAALEKELATLSLSTAIARRYIEWQRLEDQLDIGRGLVEQRESLLSLTQKRVSAGLDSNVQLRAAEAATPDARVDLSILQAQAELARLELVALVGAAPDRASSLQRPALSSPALMTTPTLVPAELLARRPDVIARRLRAQAAASRADSAKADLYPNINLAASVGLDSKTFTDWVDAGSKFYNVGPAVSLPLFGGGLRRATLRLRGAEYDEAVAQYKKTLLEAVRDTALALTDLRSIDAGEPDALAAVKAQEQSHALAQRRYEGGLGTYTDVLIAEAQLLNQRRRIADLKARRLDASIRLTAALGGGVPVPADALAAAQP